MRKEAVCGRENGSEGSDGVRKVWKVMSADIGK